MASASQTLMDDWFLSIVLFATVAVWEVSKALMLGLCSHRRKKVPVIKTEQIAKQSAKQTAKHECTDAIWIAPEQGERYHASAACNGLRFAAAKQEYQKCKLCFKKTA